LVTQRHNQQQQTCHSMPACLPVFRNSFGANFGVTVSRTGSKLVRLDLPSHRRCILSNRCAKHNTIACEMLQPLEPSMDSPRCHLTVCHPQLTTNLHISNSLFFTTMTIYYLPYPTIATTFPPGDNLNLNLHALSLIDILYFPFKRSVPSSSLESHHTTPRR
jgi:hypothetical protein